MKTQLILFLYDQLISGSRVNRLEFCKQNNITERTFYRYANEIVLYLRNNKSNFVLDVVDPQGDYYLKRN